MFAQQRRGGPLFNADLEDGGAMKSPTSKPDGALSRARLVTLGGALAGLILTIFMIHRLMVVGVVSHLRSDTFPESFRIAVIADLDQTSKREKSWYSIYMTVRSLTPHPEQPYFLRTRSPHAHLPRPSPRLPQGTLRRKGETYDVSWDAPADVSTAHNEAGRGCELSELIKFHDNLYTFDDRSGIMFQVKNFARSDSADAPFLVPRHIFIEGPGDINDKGLKIEWATQKDGTLVVGSFGKEYTNNKGEVLHANNLWTVVYRADGTVAHVNWKANYDAMRATLGYAHPGYMIHEAVVWSPHFRKWYVFPRRVSRDPYDDVTDEKKGSNTIIIASHDFSEVTATTVGVRGGGPRVLAHLVCPHLASCLATRPHPPSSPSPHTHPHPPTCRW